MRANKRVLKEYVHLYTVARTKDPDKTLRQARTVAGLLGKPSVDDLMCGLYVTDRALYRLIFEALEGGSNE